MPDETHNSQPRGKSRTPDLPPRGKAGPAAAAAPYRLMLDHLLAVSDRLSEEFQSAPAFQEHWKRLNADERAEVTRREFDHIRLIVSPDTAEAAHRAQAKRIGRLHELSSFDIPLLVNFYDLVHRELSEMLLRRLDDREGAARALASVAHRFMVDLSVQASAHYEFISRQGRFFLDMDRAIQESGNLTDLLIRLMAVFSELDGISAVLFSRPDANGRLQIEAHGGRHGAAYARALSSGQAPMFSIEGATPAGQGPAGRAWRTREFQLSESINSDASIQPWGGVRAALRLRASAAVPLLDLSGEPFALLSLYSFAHGYFNGPNRTTMLKHVQQAMGHAIRISERSRVIPVSLRNRYFELVSNGGAEMYYQPIVSLPSGAVSHVEALARLKDADGAVIPPAEFLPALGNAGLLKLFGIGLDQACRNLTEWTADPSMPKLNVSLNLPSEGLIDDKYVESIETALERFHIGPDALQLEILEAADPHDVSRGDAKIARFQRMGLKLVQDDLGAGHSSLLRFDRIRFDGVKIDQALVRGARTAPWRALEFIHHLVSLAHDVHVPVTVEGLENPGLIEAATILGADFGQGYGIARPMPASELPAWARRHAFPYDAAAPKTALGLLAKFLLWDREALILSQNDALSEQAFAPWRFNGLVAELAKDEETRLARLTAEGYRRALADIRSCGYVSAKGEIIAFLESLWLRSA